ncbi:MAG: 4Fe-4S dicluster domain-containing protein [Acidobacteria bacterium]|nr:4Fe-4S dicluster domain-containing protein [Acidobacteriota bacterium]
MTKPIEIHACGTRRDFLKYSLGTTAALSAIAGWAGVQDASPPVILENAGGLLITDTTRCVGCRRCELACTECNDGRSQPALSRIKVGRNYNFGPRGQRAGMHRSMGEFGNFRIVQDTCLQCPHPVPCATACPHDAIIADGMTKARVVDSDKCTGCRICLRACPWEMIVFDREASKASKCFLCNGKPQCVDACPAQALRFLAWRDLTRAVPVRQATVPLTKDGVSATCRPCH